MPLEVYKFGGVAMGTPEAIRAAVARVAAARAEGGQVACVASAMQGVTDLLLAAGRAALGGDEQAWQEAATKFESRHLDVAAALLGDSARAAAVNEEIAAASRELRAMCESIAVLRELTPRAQDALVSRGERVLSRLFVAALGEAGVDAVYVDATDVILTERRLGGIWPSFPKCARAAHERVLPLLARGQVVVMPGFLGRGPDGELVTLGRGGTDFSAALLARSLDADAVTLWKEVDGLMTADPKSVDGARVLAALHYREAAELAYYGAKVLHPRTMIPLVDKKIPLFVRNAFRDVPGTRIAGDVGAGDYPVKALTAVRAQALVAIEGGGMIGVPGVAGRAFSALSQAGHSVSMISQASSEASICFVLPGEEAEHAKRALEETFALERRERLIDRIAVERGVALVAVVGLGMRGRPGIAARTFSAISAAGVNVLAIAQGSSELNITVAVPEADATRALQALHREYQLDKRRPLADTTGRASKLTLLGFGQIGRALAEQLVAQQKHLRQRLGVEIEVTAIADRSGVRVEEHGIDAGALRDLAAKKAAGGRLFADRSPLSLQELQQALRDELWLLPSHRPILVDLTSEETAPLLQEALEEGFHVVLANKKPLAGPQLAFEELLDTARRGGLSLRYEATAGAGLPVLDTLAKLQESGDRVESILGCFSGTLGFLMTALESGTRFSAAVREAWRRGYTEPDPREDLSGRDVARKALILARTLGRRVELDEIALEALFPPQLDDADPASFVDKLAALDEPFAERAAKAKRDGKVLRYVARVGPRSIRVGIEAVAAASPMGRLSGTANQVVIQSRRYHDNPLVVTGPGAGAQVTAAGVLNDIVAITVQERRGESPSRAAARPRRRRAR
ncbi:MAG TPA: bifunctional aspartate kinase/homoserine dehydrogenase I [Thermoanaerobaculia bacterium]|jgi:aspartokinase/homoserine dehydrogenase 1|nr:bifunctional aspartate kinase/homoserine dehydrogenase I [Thermoanaerobaculia bacterium]